jgi:hypothetical protein
MLPGDLGVSGQRGHAGYLKGGKEKRAGLWYRIQYSCTVLYPDRNMRSRAEHCKQWYGISRL